MILASTGANLGNICVALVAQRRRLLEPERIQEFGNCNVPVSHKPLGTWVSTQRTQRRQSGEGKLSQDRIRRLDELGFNWGTTMA